MPSSKNIAGKSATARSTAAASERASNVKLTSAQANDITPDCTSSANLTAWLTAADTANDTSTERVGSSKPTPATVKEPDTVATDITKIYNLLSEISSGQNTKLDEIYRATTSMESKLNSITLRPSEVESRLEFLENRIRS